MTAARGVRLGTVSDLAHTEPFFSRPVLAGAGASLLVHVVVGVVVVLAAKGTPASTPTLTAPRPARLVRDLVRLTVIDRRPAPATAAMPESVRSPSNARERPTRLARTAPAAAPSHVPLEPSPVTGEGATATTDGTVDAPSEPVPAGPPATSTGGAAAAPNTPDGPSDAIVADVHARLSLGAKDCYPERAKRFRQTARVPMSFCVGADGRADGVTVGHSGVDVLDEAARSCVLGKAQPFSAGAAGHCFSVGVEFGG